jgi:hypothetical protein
MAFGFPKLLRFAADAPTPVASEGGPARKLSLDRPATAPEPSRAADRRPFPRTLAEAIRLRRPGHGA